MIDQKNKNESTGKEITDFPCDGKYLTLGCNGSHILFVHCPENDYNSKVYELNLENYRFSYRGILKDIGKNSDSEGFILNTMDGSGFSNKDIFCKMMKKIF